MIRVKVCGITSIADARCAVEAGADALGFIFVEQTPRYVDPAAAAAIIGDLPPFVTAVGIFWDHPAAHVKAVAAEVRRLWKPGAERDAQVDGLKALRSRLGDGPTASRVADEVLEVLDARAKDPGLSAAR